MALSRIAVAVAVLGGARAEWDERQGACRINTDGSGEGAADTDFVRHSKETNEVNDLQHCKDKCASWPADHEGAVCFGIEAKNVGAEGTDVDYCEFWLTKPEGKSSSAEHGCHLLDAGTWRDEAGACRVDSAGENGGTENTDYVRYNKAKDGAAGAKVKDLAQCKTACETWATNHEGQQCYGIEVKVTGVDDFDYCEVWITKPEGTSEVDKHYCAVYEAPSVGAKGAGATPDEVSATITQRSVTGFVSFALLGLIV